MVDKVVKKVKKVAKKAAAKGAEIKAARNNSSAAPKVNSGKLMLLVSIVPNNKAEFYTDL